MAPANKHNLHKKALINYSQSKSQVSQASLSESSAAETPPTSPNSRTPQGSSSLPDTPLKTSTHGPEAGHPTVAAMTEVLKAEIQGTTQVADNHFFTRVVKKRVQRAGVLDSSIANFVETSGLYNPHTRRWNNLTTTTVENQLYAPFIEIFKKVIATFGLKEREVLHTYNMKIRHIEGSSGDSNLKTSPDLFVYGSGSNFQAGNIELEHKDKADYHYCASPCEIKTENNLSEEGVVAQVGVYARQCFIQQGNRHYVYSLVMTEDRVFLLQFDRNGVLRTKCLNIHENPQYFVYLILLVSSPNCRTLGFDTNVYWKGDKRYIRTVGEEGKRVEYEIINSKPFFQRRTIRGRGTLCWLVGDRKGRLRIIKDSWQAEGRIPEKDLLLEVKGFKGVGQMVASDPVELTIADLRGMKGEPLPTGMVDRLFRRIILEAYGSQMDEFADRKEFLYGFRDAVAGHQNMWNENIIHRDISVNNILIGGKDAEEGWRGVVIDMDMAVHWQRERTMATVDFRTGTRTYQSIFVLRSERDKEAGLTPLAHDHLDDLESFFYLFCWVCMGYTQYGQRVQCEELQSWEDENLLNLIKTKTLFLTQDPIMHVHNEVVNTFGTVFQALFEALREFLRQMHFWKIANRDKMPTTHEGMRVHSDQHYATFLHLVDKAIVDLEKEEEEKHALLQSHMALPRSPSRHRPSSSPPAQSSAHPASPAPAPTPAASPHSSHHPESLGGMKRTRDERDADGDWMDVDGEETAPPPKRPQTRSLTRSQPAPTLPAPSEVNVAEAPPPPPPRRRSTRSRTSAKQPEVPLVDNAASSSSDRRRTRSLNSTSGVVGKKGPTRTRTRSGGTRGMRTRMQSGGGETMTTMQPAETTSLRRGRSATRKVAT